MNKMHWLIKMRKAGCLGCGKLGFSVKACLLPQEKTGFNLKFMFFLVYFDADFT